PSESALKRLRNQTFSTKSAQRRHSIQMGNACASIAQSEQQTDFATLPETTFSYPANDEDSYLSWYQKIFSSVFVATNPFLNLPNFPLNTQGNWIPEGVNAVAKQRGANASISWQEISELCGFPSIAHVNRALRLTGSQRVLTELASPADTEKMLEVCKGQNFFVPDEGRFSPLAQLSLARFLKELGHDRIIVANDFGTSPRMMKSKELLLPDRFEPAEIQAMDGSVYICIYTDYHYFLVCQSDQSFSVANPMSHFEGFFADENTNDLWGVGDLCDNAKGS
ncbi:MAG: hypothetical protein AAFN79_13630, partial [Pseudomonadota bacterium]